MKNFKLISLLTITFCISLFYSSCFPQQVNNPSKEVGPKNGIDTLKKREDLKNYQSNILPLIIYKAPDNIDSFCIKDFRTHITDTIQKGSKYEVMRGEFIYSCKNTVNNKLAERYVFATTSDKEFKKKYFIMSPDIYFKDTSGIKVFILTPFRENLVETLQFEILEGYEKRLRSWQDAYQK